VNLEALPCPDPLGLQSLSLLGLGQVMCTQKTFGVWHPVVPRRGGGGGGGGGLFFGFYQQHV
jgi:hypothetical protein